MYDARDAEKNFDLSLLMFSLFFPPEGSQNLSFINMQIFQLTVYNKSCFV